MRIIVLIVAIFGGVQILLADDIGYEWDSYNATNQYKFQVSSASINKTPIWRESDDQPPLPARKALRAARNSLVKLVADGAQWRLEEVSLSPLSENEGHWIYLVKFYPPLPPSGVFEGHIEPMIIPVLMSGIAIEPKINPSSLWKK